jgi:serine protease Do
VALGSGFIIDPRGYIVTTNHVVANAEKVTVIFQDQSSHPAKVIGREQRTDLALLKIKTPANRCPMSLGATATPSRSATGSSRSATRSASAGP